MSKMTARKPPTAIFAPKLREEDDFADGALAAEQHDQPVDADAQAAGRGHAVLQRQQEVFVQHLHLVLAGRLATRLLQEALPLVEGVVQLRVGVAHLQPGGERLEALHEVRVVRLALGQRRKRRRVVHQERRLDELRLDGARTAARRRASPSLRPARSRCPSRRISVAQAGLVATVVLQVDVGVLLERVVHGQPSPGRR